MSSRREFLLQCFGRFEDRAIPYCVLRNFDDVLEGAGSDVDLLTSTEDVTKVLQACEDAAQECGYRRVQKARFVNHTLIYWDGGSNLIRIDIDTEVRWHFWPVLTSEEILAQRCKAASFYIPSPFHEAGVLQTQMVWMGRATERYTQRLAELGFPPEEVAAIRQRIRHQTLFRPRKWLDVLTYLARDLQRTSERLLRPPGATLEIFSEQSIDLEPLLSALSTIFPKARSRVLSAGQSTFATAFRGGLAIRIQDTRSLVSRLKKRIFVALMDAPGHIDIAHASSGCMARLSTTAEMAVFILEGCAREQKSEGPSRTGRSVILVGLDGAGKTTYARQLCSEIFHRESGPAVHYFHWLPSLGNIVEFPWPHRKDVPRKRPPKRHALATAGSMVRLVKNIALANLAWYWRIQPLVRKGHLVILDRFLYNYWLDPDSVRFTAPSHWLEWFQKFLPKADVLVILQADAETLRARKQELTETQIDEQMKRLVRLPVVASKQLELDATQSPVRLVQETWDALSIEPP